MPKLPCIDITYAAHTASCTFLLDAEGICRRIVMVPKGKRREGSRTAARCVGAQYVASLDGKAAGGLVEMPRVGAAMLFARVDERGRVSLVRTGILTSFESMGGEDPFVESGTVETSAPDVLAARATPAPERLTVTPATARSPEHPPRTARMPPAPAQEPEPYADPDADTYADGDRTQRIQALRPEDIAAALGGSSRSARAPAPVPTHDFSTAEYRAVADDEDDHRPTLVPAPKTPARGMLPRGSSDPRQRAAGAARAYAPPARSSDVQVSRRRRGT